MSDTTARAGTFLTFRLNGEVFGLDIAWVREIVEYDGSITRVPRTPEFMQGVMNLRGNVVPVVDMNLKLGLRSSPPTEDTCIIIAEMKTGDETMVLGVVVDAVEEVLELTEGDILAPPPAGTLLRAEFLTGLARRDNGFIMLVRVSELLSIEELAGLKDPSVKEAARPTA